MPTRTQPPPARSNAFAKVALPVPVGAAFTYQVPQDLQTDIFVGCRVEVPFGRRVLSGIVVELLDQSDVPRTRPIQSIYETYLPTELVELTTWIAAYYGCTVGEAAQSVLPPLLKRSRRAGPLDGVVTLRDGRETIDAHRAAMKRARRQLALVERLAESGGAAPAAVVLGEWGFDTAHIKALIDKGIAELHPAPERPSILAALEPAVGQLNEEQAQALRSIQASLASKTFSPILLQGVTSSGKTEVYLRAARQVLSEDGGCIILVPEIGLLPQAITRYRRVFGDAMAVLHSRLTGPERFEMWKRIESGGCRAVLGPRSAVFSPVRNLRLIIVDEEQDDSYKQDDKPRYHARSVALMRGKFQDLTVVLGSATPSVESYYHATTGLYQHLKLTERVGGLSLPDVTFIDMRGVETEGAFFSPYLLERLEDNVRHERQSIIFLNKRGHARFVQCNACGWAARCRNCDISLTYHRVNNQLRCHFCGYSRPAVNRCDKCGSPKLYFAGAGTQRVELDLESFFPGVGILRMDADTTSGKEGHRGVLEKFSTGKYPILVGTQMVTKGHHFPRVNLVGILFAEESLNYPDFRSAERTFQQLIQVSGRAGRAGAGGEVIVQTFIPEHNVFTFLKTHDYDGFMKEELNVRQQLKYPPYSRMILSTCTAPAQNALHMVVQRWSDEMRRLVRRKPIEILGPVPPIVARVKNRYREHILIKGTMSNTDKADLRASFENTVEKIRGARSVDLRWDVDPESFY